MATRAGRLLTAPVAAVLLGTAAPAAADTAEPAGFAAQPMPVAGRAAQPEEVAQAILYLASPSAEFASGTVLDFNGASHLRM